MNRQQFRRGFRAGAPLWIAAAPFAIAYVVIAQEAGFDSIQIQLMSLTIYMATTQIIVAQLLINDATIATLMITALVMNIHHLLYGMSLAQHLKLTLWQKLLVAFPLTDFAYGITAFQTENLNVMFLLGIEVSVFLAWNLYTAIALAFKPLLQDVSHLHFDFIVPLSFFVLLVGSIKHRIDIAVAGFAGILAVLCAMVGLNSIAILVAATLAPLFGLLLERSQSMPSSEESA